MENKHTKMHCIGENSLQNGEMCTKMLINLQNGFLKNANGCKKCGEVNSRN